MPSFVMEGYYREMMELQDKLRRSEEERFRLEEKFNEMMRMTRDAEHERLRSLRHKYNRFIEDDRKRQERNKEVLKMIERIETRATAIAAKTDRYNELRKQYANYLKARLQNQSQPSERLTPRPNLTPYQPSFRRKLFSDQPLQESHDSKVAKSKLNLLEQYIRENNDAESFLGRLNELTTKLNGWNSESPDKKTYDKLFDRVLAEQKSQKPEFEITQHSEKKPELIPNGDALDSSRRLLGIPLDARKFEMSLSKTAQTPGYQSESVDSVDSVDDRQASALPRWLRMDTTPRQQILEPGKEQEKSKFPSTGVPQFGSSLDFVKPSWENRLGTDSFPGGEEINSFVEKINSESKLLEGSSEIGAGDNQDQDPGVIQKLTSFATLSKQNEVATPLPALRSVAFKKDSQETVLEKTDTLKEEKNIMESQSLQKGQYVEEVSPSMKIESVFQENQQDVDKKFEQQLVGDQKDQNYEPEEKFIEHQENIVQTHEDNKQQQQLPVQEEQQQEYQGQEENYESQNQQFEPQEMQYEGQEQQYQDVQYEGQDQQYPTDSQYEGQDQQYEQYQGEAQQYEGQDQYQGQDQQSLSQDQQSQGQNQQYEGQDPQYQGQDPQYQGQNQQYEGQDPQYQGQDPQYEGQEQQYQEEQKYQGQDQQYLGQDQQYQGPDQQYQSKEQEFQGQDQQYQGQDVQYQGQDQQYQGEEQQYQGQDEQYQGQDEQYQGQDEQYQGQDEQYHGQDPQHHSQDEQYQGQDQHFQGQDQQYQDQDSNLQQYDGTYDESQYQYDPNYVPDQQYQTGYEGESQDYQYNQQYAHQEYDPNYQQDPQSQQAYQEVSSNEPQAEQVQPQQAPQDSSYSQQSDNAGNIEGIFESSPQAVGEKPAQSLSKLLESDTESSLKHDTKVSNDSDFDFSHG